MEAVTGDGEVVDALHHPLRGIALATRQRIAEPRGFVIESFGVLGGTKAANG